MLRNHLKSPKAVQMPLTSHKKTIPTKCEKAETLFLDQAEGNKRSNVSKNKAKQKFRSKTKSGKKGSKHSSRDSKKSKNQPKKQVNNQNLKMNTIFTRSRHKLTQSQQKDPKVFQRKNSKRATSTSKKTSKKSTDTENEQTLIEKLKAENQFYRNALVISKDSLQKLQKHFVQQKKKHTNEKEWFQYQINKLKNKVNISSQSIKIGHLYSYERFKDQEISNMIIETQNQGSSLTNQLNSMGSSKKIMRKATLEQTTQQWSKLSIDSK